MTQDAKEFAREIYFDDDGRGGTSLERIEALITARDEARDEARDAELVERIVAIVEKKAANIREANIYRGRVNMVAEESAGFIDALIDPIRAARRTK